MRRLFIAGIFSSYQSVGGILGGFYIFTHTNMCCWELFYMIKWSSPLRNEENIKQGSTYLA